MKRILIPVIKKVLPNLIDDIIGVQPMADRSPEINSFVPENFAMMTLHQRSVNVDRLELIEKLKQNLAIHRAEYQEALVECHRKLIEDLDVTLKKVSKLENPEKLRKFDFDFKFPPNHEQDYIDVIEMLEMSKDALINLDSSSFKAYIKNEWNWSHSFNATKLLYSSSPAGAAFSNSNEL